MKGLSKLQKRILTQALTPSENAIKFFSNAEMDFTRADAWPDHCPSDSERAALSRSLRRLEERGLLDRSQSQLYGRVAFRLTDLGRIVAMNLSASANEKLAHHCASRRTPLPPPQARNARLN